MEPVDPVAEEATDQEELAGERASEQETITGKGTKTVERRGTFKKGYCR